MAKISVLMGIYNCSNTLADAVKSIQAQTVSDWELIMCDDGSSDNTYDIACELANQDDRIHVIRNEKNCGLNQTLNNCLAHAHGEYIARMDGDDLCSPDRFEKEIDVLDHEPEFAIVSCDMECFDEAGTWGRVHYKEFPTAQGLIHGSQFCHAGCMVRKAAFDAVGGYSVSKKLLRVEDYHLWVKMYADGFKGKNIPLPLYQMRDDRSATVRRKFRYRLNEAYVKLVAVKILKLPVWNIIYAIKPILIGLMPNTVYEKLHKKRLG